MSQKSQIYNRIASLCSRKEMCRYDANNYLKKFKELNADDRNEIVDQLVKEKFIDEERYTDAFVNDSFKYNKWGKNKIIYTLRSKGIKEQFITSAINKIDNELYNEIKNNLADNKRKSLDIDDPMRERKVEAFLKSKGF